MKNKIQNNFTELLAPAGRVRQSSLFESKIKIYG
jgi:hypothetical protein